MDKELERRLRDAMKFGTKDGVVISMKDAKRILYRLAHENGSYGPSDSERIKDELQ